jgi:hypothetical protein
MLECFKSNEINVTRQDDVLFGELIKECSYAPRAQRGMLIVAAPSVHSLLRHVQKYFPSPHRGKSSSKQTSAFDSFNYFTSYDDCLDTYLNRPYTLRQFEAIDERLTTPMNGNEVFYDVTGDFIDIGRYLTGEPEHFGQMTMGTPRGIFCDIIINITASATTDQKIINARAQRLNRLIDWLENENIRTSLRAIQTSQCNHAEVMVKNYEDSFDGNSLAIVLNSDFLRRILFRYIEHSKTWEAGYGSVWTHQKNHLNLPPEWIETNTISLVSENAQSVTIVNEKFDRLEQLLKDAIANGETAIHGVL